MPGLLDVTATAIRYHLEWSSLVPVGTGSVTFQLYNYVHGCANTTFGPQENVVEVLCLELRVLVEVSDTSAGFVNGLPGELISIP